MTTAGSAELAVSAIIPTRNRPEAVVAAVGSALAQTYRPLDVWVVDDGSTPPLELPASLAGDERVHLLRAEVPGGAGAARNLAVKHSGSPLLAFLDDDDAWRPDKTARQVAVLEHSAGRVAAIDAGFELWDGDRLLRRRLPTADRDLRKEMLRRPCLTTSTVIMRRDAFEFLGGFRTDMSRTEDWELWLRLVDDFAVVTVRQVLVDRQQSRIPAEVLVTSYRQFVRELAPRIAALAPPERLAVEAWHLLVLGVHHAQAGQARLARRTLWQAWRTDWRAPRPLLHLARTYLGERRWETIARARGVGRR